MSMAENAVPCLLQHDDGNQSTRNADRLKKPAAARERRALITIDSVYNSQAQPDSISVGAVTKNQDLKGGFGLGQGQCAPIVSNAGSKKNTATAIATRHPTLTIYCDEPDPNAQSSSLATTTTTATAATSYQDVSSKPDHNRLKTKQQISTVFCRGSKERVPLEALTIRPVPSAERNVLSESFEAFASSRYAFSEDDRSGYSGSTTTDTIEESLRNCDMFYSGSSKYSTPLLHLKDQQPKQTRDDLLTCFPEYAEDIYNHLRLKEERLRPNPRYMEQQPEISEAMRTILVDWIVDVALEYRLEQETLYLSIAYIDRFLSAVAVTKDKLQLVGTTAVMIAAKFEEIYPPEVKDFVYITDDTYNKGQTASKDLFVMAAPFRTAIDVQVLKMEKIMLGTLHFDVAAPTANSFLSCFLKASPVHKRCECLAMYLCELALMDYGCLQFLPSHLAAAATCLARIILEEAPWPPRLAGVSGYTVSAIIPCMEALLRAFQAAANSKYKATLLKYMDNRYHQVSLITPPSTVPLNSRNGQ